ncbi:MAG TPA: hypothetical protein VF765_33870 [Polyangiaceae bacterium]
MVARTRRARRPAVAGSGLALVVIVAFGCSEHSPQLQAPQIQAALVPGEAYGVATDATSVYWTRDTLGTVMKCTAADCNGTAAVLASDQSYPLDIAVDEARVYWATGGNAGTEGAIVSCPIDGGTPTTLASRQAQVESIAIDAKNVYWTRFDDESLFMCPKDGCGAGPILLWKGTGVESVGSVSGDGTDLYWGGGPALLECAAPGCNGAPVTLVTLASNVGPSGLAVDASDIYWTTVFINSPSTLMRCAKSDCAGTAVTIASGPSIWMNVVSDATSLYWTAAKYGSVVRCAKPGCAGGPVTLASGGPPSDPGSTVAVNATTVYWTTQAGLMSAPK